MNEDQEHNDHKLHINPCICGFQHPKVMGDDCDADVHCPRCDRTTPNCYGTKGAIKYWNENKIPRTEPFMHTFKLSCLYDPTDCRVITEGDYMHTDSNIPYLASNQVEIGEMERARDRKFTHCQLKRVEVTIKECQPQPPVQDKAKP